MEMLKNNPYIPLISRIIVGSVFIVVGVTKILDPKLFANEIGNYDLLPNYVLHIPAIILPWIELVVGMLLVLGIKLKTNSLIAGTLLVIFTIGVITAWSRGLDINCGCFSAIKEEKVGLSKVLQNSGLILLTILTFISNSTKFKLKSED
jgi:uncharacterized membrane protein YphA (DoxX/SURF4 family)